MFFEATISNLYFRYDGGTVIEVSRVGDKDRVVLHEIYTKELEDRKSFDKEISFWFMERGNDF